MNKTYWNINRANKKIVFIIGLELSFTNDLNAGFEPKIDTTGKPQIIDTWKEHFDNLLNMTSCYDSTTLFDVGDQKKVIAERWFKYTIIIQWWTFEQGVGDFVAFCTELIWVFVCLSINNHCSKIFSFGSFIGILAGYKLTSMIKNPSKNNLRHVFVIQKKSTYG